MNTYQDWTFVVDPTCDIIEKPIKTMAKCLEPVVSRFVMGNIVDGYQLVTQKSTGYSKWISRFELSTKEIDEAFYDADWSFKP